MKLPNLPLFKQQNQIQQKSKVHSVQKLLQLHQGSTQVTSLDEM